MLTMNVTEAIRLHQKAKAAVDVLGPRASNEAFERACSKEQGALRLIERLARVICRRRCSASHTWKLIGKCMARACVRVLPDCSVRSDPPMPATAFENLGAAPPTWSSRLSGPRARG
jgi:hypothetical protein